MSCMNASVHDLHHCTKLQLSTGCSFGVVTQTRHKFPEFHSGKSARTGICTIVRVKKPNLHIALMNCVFLTVILKYQTSNVSSFGCVTILLNYIFTRQ